MIEDQHYEKKRVAKRGKGYLLQHRSKGCLGWQRTHQKKKKRVRSKRGRPTGGTAHMGEKNPPWTSQQEEEKKKGGADKHL